MTDLNIFTELNEVQLARYYEPKPGLFIAESPKVIARALDAGYEPVCFLVEEKQAEGEAKPVLERIQKQAEVRFAAPEDITKITGYAMTRGALCAMRRKTLPSLEDICRDARRIAVLENVVNPTNVGAIIRNAAGLGMDAVILTKGCSDPLYRRALRVSMGTALQIPWTFIETENYVERLKKAGFSTAAMALEREYVAVDDPKLMNEERLAVILGTEGEGLLPSTIEQADYTVCVPMSYGVDSLNVACASAIAFWQLGRKYK